MTQDNSAESLLSRSLKKEEHFFQQGKIKKPLPGDFFGIG
jgi:hypothetical protein